MENIGASKAPQAIRIINSNNQYSVNFIPNSQGLMNSNTKIKLVGKFLFFLFLFGFPFSLILAYAQDTLESQGLHFRLIPAGYYLLGSPLSEPGRYADEDTPHRVRVDSFYMAVTETTNAQYQRFLKATGHQAPLYWEDKKPQRPQPAGGGGYLGRRRGLLPLAHPGDRRQPQSLPSEAQWEAAARGGLTGQPYPWGAEAPDAGGVYRANLRHDRTAKDGYLFTAPVGSFSA